MMELAYQQLEKRVSPNGGQWFWYGRYHGTQAGSRSSGQHHRFNPLQYYFLSLALRNSPLNHLVPVLQHGSERFLKRALRFPAGVIAKLLSTSKDAFLDPKGASIATRGESSS